MNLQCANGKSAMPGPKTSCAKSDAVLGADHDFSFTRHGGGDKLVYA